MGHHHHSGRMPVRPFLSPTSCTGCQERRPGAGNRSAPTSPGTRSLRRSKSASTVGVFEGHQNGGSVSLPSTPRVQDYTTKTIYTPHRSQSIVPTTQISDYGDSASSDTESSFMDLEPIRVQKWTEYTARKSIVKFRNRRSAKRSSLGRRHQEVALPPSVAVHRLLHSEYDKCRSEHTLWSERLAAVLYCWFFGWIQEVYSSLTENGSVRSLSKWVLACVLVTSAAILCLGLTVTLLHLVVTLVSALTHAALNFALLTCSTLLMLLGLLTVLSFDRS